MTTEQKTKPTAASVEDFINAVDNPRRREDARAALALMAEISGAPPVMWGPSMVGFGSYHYRGRSGREGEWFRIGFSPRKANLVLYLHPYFEGANALVERLGKVKRGVGCIYVTDLGGLDERALRELVQKSFDFVGGGGAPHA